MIIVHRLTLGIILFAMIFLLACKTEPVIPHLNEAKGKQEYPGEWMYNQRAFPDSHINQKVYQAAIVQAKLARQSQSRRHQAPWQSVGPINIGGRVTDVALHPTNPDIIYIGAANGGVFKSVDGGLTWDHIYINDGKLAIGNIQLAPSDPNVIYVGTGEANGGFSTGAFVGDGIHRSDDGGETWRSLGLPESHHIGRIVVDPKDADRVFVAATGYLYGKNTQRGIYRSLDGGEQWDRVLHVSDSTSAIDVAIDPLHPDTLYAAFWERLRFPDVRDYAGTSSGIHRSFDGGETWERLTNGLPVNENVGRIGLAVSPTGDVVYAAYSNHPITNDFAGLYASHDAGETWTRIDDGTLEDETIYSGFGWFFGNVRVDPSNGENIYVLGLNTWRSENGGVSWSQLTFEDVHVDHHALEIHPLNSDFIVLGTDGGLYISHDGGFFWDHVETLPINEFYACEIDDLAPERYYGGAQDNGTLRTLTGASDDWERIFGGDGFRVLVDPVDNDIIYVEYQFGFLYKSYDGGFEWDYSLVGINGFDRTNWFTPYIISPHNHNRMYYGTHRLYTSVDGAVDWNLMSDDLTNTDPSSPGGEDFGALSTIAVAPSDSNVIYTGSEDGYVYVTFDHGEEWTRISDDLPLRYITQIAIDPLDALIAYVTISGYRHFDYMPHIFRTDDGGETWTDVSGNLPEVPLNDVIIDSEIPGTLYVASDLGVWYTEDGGESWSSLGDGLPMTSYNDLDLHVETRKLLAASFGLSMWTYDLGEPVSGVTHIESVVAQLQIYPNPVRDLATIDFQLTEPTELMVVVHDASGRKITTLEKRGFNAGQNQVHWHPDVTPGAYVISIQGKRANVSRVVEVY